MFQEGKDFTVEMNTKDNCSLLDSNNTPAEP